MFAVFVIFLIMGLIEGAYLLQRGRKIRTYIIVYAVMGVSLVYNLLAVKSGQALNPNRIIQAILQR